MPTAPLFLLRAGVLLAIAALAGCSLPLPDKPVRAEPYDLGLALPLADNTHAASGVPLALADVQAPAAIDTRHMVYRLLYVGDAQQPRPYAQARWTMPPAQLVTQRLRDALSAQHPVVAASSALAAIDIQARLDEFSQLFSSPSESTGVVRLRVTAFTAPSAAGGSQLLGQHLFMASRPAPTPDANGGAQALRLATDDVVRQAVDWIDTLRPNP
ncbi:MAG: hypothetical protein EPN34_14040 [Burkholderiaceae bacterium]|nr:MAG: hypothetical protein EPN34_14040 [Burkholderiaceae bacterium]